MINYNYKCYACSSTWKSLTWKNINLLASVGRDKGLNQSRIIDALVWKINNTIKNQLIDQGSVTNHNKYQIFGRRMSYFSLRKNPTRNSDSLTSEFHSRCKNELTHYLHLHGISMAWFSNWTQYLIVVRCLSQKAIFDETFPNGW